MRNLLFRMALCLGWSRGAALDCHRDSPFPCENGMNGLGAGRSAVDGIGQRGSGFLRPKDR